MGPSWALRKDKDGNIVGTGPTIGSLLLPKPDIPWNGEIALLGEESKNISKELHVGAWHLKTALPSWNIGDDKAM
jgi:hypothetical protein